MVAHGWVVGPPTPTPEREATCTFATTRSLAIIHNIGQAFHHQHCYALSNRVGQWVEERRSVFSRCATKQMLASLRLARLVLGKTSLTTKPSTALSVSVYTLRYLRYSFATLLGCPSSPSYLLPLIPVVWPTMLSYDPMLMSMHCLPRGSKVCPCSTLFGSLMLLCHRVSAIKQSFGECRACGAVQFTFWCKFPLWSSRIRALHHGLPFSCSYQ